MKKLINILVVLVLLISACEYDNYDPPKSELTGRIVYGGETLGVRHDLDVLQLYEPGWQNFDPISLTLKQDGTFSALLFDGDYKLVLIPGNGPWIDQTDTIDIQVRGSQVIEVPVEPFFMIRNESIGLDGTTLVASLDLDQVVEGEELQFVSLYVGNTRLVDNQSNGNFREEKLSAGSIDDMSETITLRMDLSEVNKDFVYARIGVKTKGRQELLFSQVQKIQLQ